jgi:hypothetical protein
MIIGHVYFRSPYQSRYVIHNKLINAPLGGLEGGGDYIDQHYT